jgi:hypothetical protein
MKFIAPLRNSNPSFAASTIANISVATDKNPYYYQLQKDFVDAIEQKDAITSTFFHQKMENDLKDKLNEVMPGLLVTVIKTLGIWEGGLEPSFQLRFNRSSNQAIDGIITTARHFQQDSVHFLHPSATGNHNPESCVLSSVREFKLKQPIPIPHLQKLLGLCGLGGAQCSTDARHITLYNALTGEQLASKRTAKKATLQWSIAADLFAKGLNNVQQTSTTDALFTSYGTSIQSAIKTYDQRNPIPTFSNNNLFIHQIKPY